MAFTPLPAETYRGPGPFGVPLAGAEERMVRDLQLVQFKSQSEALLNLTTTPCHEGKLRLAGIEESALKDLADQGLVAIGRTRAFIGSTYRLTALGNAIQERLRGTAADHLVPGDAA